MARSTNVQVKNKDSHLTVSQHDTDAPILPVAQMERLHSFHPEAVPWIIEEATREGQFRRSETKRVNTFVFSERILGIAAGLIVATLALNIAKDLAMEGHYTVAGIIGGTTVVALVGAFIVGRRKGATKE